MWWFHGLFPGGVSGRSLVPGFEGRALPVSGWGLSGLHPFRPLLSGRGAPLKLDKNGPARSALEYWNG